MTSHEQQQVIKTRTKQRLLTLRQQVKGLMKTADTMDPHNVISAVYFNNMALFDVLAIIDDHIAEVDT